MTPALVMVTWDDATGHATRPYVKERDHAPVVMTCVGWLVARDRAGISVASEQWTEDGTLEYRGWTFIPSGMVRKIQKLK